MVFVQTGGFPIWARPSQLSGKRRAHKHKLFCSVGLGTTPGLSRGFHRVCPWDKSGENLGQTRVFFLFYTVEARFHRVCPWDKPGLSLGQSRGRRAAQKVYVKKKVYVPFLLAQLVLFCPFWEFPDLHSGIFQIFPAISPICPFPLPRPIKAHARNSSERLPDTIRTFPGKSGSPPVLEPPGSSLPLSLCLSISLPISLSLSISLKKKRSLQLLPANNQKFQIGALEKGLGICIELSETCSRICEMFVTILGTPPLDVRNEGFSLQVAAKSAQRALCATSPFSTFLTKQGSDVLSCNILRGLDVADQRALKVAPLAKGPLHAQVRERERECSVASWSSQQPPRSKPPGPQGAQPRDCGAIAL